MRKIYFFGSLFLAAAAAAAPAKSAGELLVRAVAWDGSFKPATDKEFAERVAAVVAAAAKDGADAVVFPEGFSKDRGLEVVLDGVKDAAGADRFVVLGGAPVIDPASGKAFSRTYILSGGSWQRMDKLDPTAAERALKTPVSPGGRLLLFRFRGAVVAALAASSIEKPEIAASLKKRAVQLVLVSAPARDAEGEERLARCASARAAELGAAVVTAPASGKPALYLPAQKGFDKPRPPAGRDFRLPWKKLLDLRASPDAADEAPYLEPAPYYQIEI